MFGIGTARSWLEPSGVQLEIGRVEEERDGGDELGDGVRVVVVVVVDVDRGGCRVCEDWVAPCSTKGCTSP